MSRPAPSDSGPLFTAARYFDLLPQGMLSPDDRVELLDGVIVAMSPQSAKHAVTTTRVRDALLSALAGRATVREDKPLVLGDASVPEPDLAVVALDAGADESHHPDTALLVVEVADSSLAQDRLTKTRIYARARIPEYWIVNLRDDRVEVFRRPQRRTYRERTTVERGGTVALVAFPDTSIPVAALLPRPRPA